MRDEEFMSEKALNSYLELLAKLVEATAKTPEDAAEIIRSSKIELEKG